MLSLTKVRELNISAPLTEGRFAHFSAASGLVCINSIAYVVADDELHLGAFPIGGKGFGEVIPLFQGALPVGKQGRKNEKPDLEALTLLPAFSDYPQGALLALGSGSRRNRYRGVILGLNASGGVSGLARAVDLSALLEPLEDEFHALNIEGAFVSGNELRLLQRGNSKHAENAVVRVPLAPVLDALHRKKGRAIKPIEIHPVDLGHVDRIPLTFTDGAALPDGGMIFTAAAEKTDDPYEDGLCAGAAVGIADRNLNLRWLEMLERPYKVEGIDAQVKRDAIKLLLVTDQDDHDVPASLFSTVIRPHPLRGLEA